MAPPWNPNDLGEADSEEERLRGEKREMWKKIYIYEGGGG